MEEPVQAVSSRVQQLKASLLRAPACDVHRVHIVLANSHGCRPLSISFVRPCFPSSQAADLPSALQGLLRQAQGLLKPPSRGAAGAAGPPPASAASRRALVLGILLLLERTALLAKQQRDARLIKASG
jgi:hypothetical protein